MDYKDKYLKYKTKYLILKNQIGGNDNFVSGPISFRYLKNEISRKNLFIFGDRHESIDNMCEPGQGKPLHIFISEIIENNKDIQFDIGIEQNKDNTVVYKFTEGPMVKFDNHFKENKIKNLRLHKLDHRIIKEMKSNSDFFNNSDDPILKKLQVYYNTFDYIKNSLEIFKLDSNEKITIPNMGLNTISISKENEHKKPSYEDENLKTSDLVNIYFMLYNIIIDLSTKNSKIMEKLKLKSKIINMSELQLDGAKLHVHYGTVNEKIGVDLIKNIIITKKCKLDYQASKDGICEKDIFYSNNLVKIMHNKIKKIKKIKKFFDLDDTYLEKNYMLGKITIDNYIRERIASLLIDKEEIFVKILHLEENLVNVFDIIDGISEKIDNLSFNHQKQIINRLYESKLNFRDIIYIASFFANFIWDIQTLIMDIYSIIRLSKNYFDNTILYLGDLHSKNIAKFFEDKLEFELISEVKKIKIDEQPNRCINVGDSFKTENLKIPDYLDNYVESDKLQSQDRKLMEEEDIDSEEIAKMNKEIQEFKALSVKKEN